MSRAFQKLAEFIAARPATILGAGLALAILSFLGARGLTMSSGIETFISPRSQTYQDFQRFSQNFSGNNMVVLLTGNSLDQIVLPENLRAEESLESQVVDDPAVISVVGPAVLVKQMSARQGGGPELPSDSQAIRSLVFASDGEVKPEFRSVLPDGQHGLIVIMLRSDLSLDEEQATSAKITDIVKGLPWQGIEATPTGAGTISAVINDLMTSSLRTMLIISVLLMLVILAVIFRVRGLFPWRWLSLGVVVVTIVYTFGIMGALGISMSMATIAVFPILIGLGVDYGIQLHNRYDEEFSRRPTAAEAVHETLPHIGPAVTVALIATSLGFASLLISPLPMVRDFAIMLIIGLATAFVAAVFLVLALLYWRGRRSQNNAIKANATQPGTQSEPYGQPRALEWVQAGLARLARAVIARPALILPIALVLTGAGLFLDTKVGVETDQNKFISQELEPIKALNALEKIVGSASSLSVLVEAQDVSDPAVLGWMLRLQARIESNYKNEVARVRSVADLVAQTNGDKLPEDAATVRSTLEQISAQVRRNFLSPDYTSANIVVELGRINIDDVQRLVPSLKAEIRELPPGIHASLTGAPTIWLELFNALTQGRRQMTFLGMGLIFLVLLIVFRLNAMKAFVATLPIALVLGWSSGVMYLLGIKFTPMTATLGALILGIGTEFTILLMMRYYEERGKGSAPEASMIEAMTRIGRAIVASGLTTFAGFAALLSATQFLILRDFGIVTMLNIFFALVSSLVVLPPLIVWLDRWQERRRRAREIARP
ncbi:MAG: RND family transporter [Chloroflexi bacterium]|nr:RND family transporter [Chloroflexota bacterium]